MRVALAQINACIGDLAGNVNRCLAAVELARRENADLVVLPEMAIPGYPPRDILFDATFSQAVFEATDDLARRASAGPPSVVGSLWPAPRRPPGHPGLYNAAVLLNDGEAQLVAAKRLLPTYDVFFESRWFLPGESLPPKTIAGRRVGFLVCEDLWDEGYDLHPPAELVAAGADLLVCISASPYRQQVMAQRLEHARRQGCPLVYVNLCGANDELIFDGQSFVIGKNGERAAQLAGFEEEVRVVDLESKEPFTGTDILPADRSDWHTCACGAGAGRDASLLSGEPLEESLYRALVLGVRDFCWKNQLERAFLGLSGGIDSAVVATIAAEALGPEQVTAVAIPSRYTSPHSTVCARELAQALGIQFEVVELERLHAAAEATLGDRMEQGTVAENVQARLRAMILMSFVNRFGGMLLNTSNKTELSLGYSTLYGDMAGTLCPIADLTKLQVIALARWINSRRAVIPRYTLERPPSAELRPDQVDPFDYTQVAPAMERLVQANQSDSALRRSEHKRWQAGVILKVSDHAFGTGRMIPITRR